MARSCEIVTGWAFDDRPPSLRGGAVGGTGPDLYSRRPAPRRLARGEHIARRRRDLQSELALPGGTGPAVLGLVLSLVIVGPGGNGSAPNSQSGDIAGGVNRRDNVPARSPAQRASSRSRVRRIFQGPKHAAASRRCAMKIAVITFWSILAVLASAGSPLAGAPTAEPMAAAKGNRGTREAGSLRFRRVYVPEGTTDWPKGNAKYLPMDAAEFDRLLGTVQRTAPGLPRNRRRALFMPSMNVV